MWHWLTHSKPLLVPYYFYELLISSGVMVIHRFDRLMYWVGEVTDVCSMWHWLPHSKPLLLPYYFYELLMSPGVMVIHRFALCKMLSASHLV
jgi:hypothetical protein